MVVGFLRVRVHLYYAPNLKEKRSQIKRVLHRIRTKFQLAAAETGDNDILNSAVLGFSVVSNDETHAMNILAHVLDELDTKGDLDAMELDREVLHLEDA